MRNTIVDRAQIVALRSGIGVLRALGWHRAVAVGGAVATLGYRPFGIRRAVVESQLVAAFPDLPSSEVARLARAAYENLGRTALETALLPWLGQQEILARVSKIEGFEALEQERARGRGVLVVSGHLGNWELGAAYVAARGRAIHAVARRMRSPAFDRYLLDTRARCGMTIIDEGEAVRLVPRALRAGAIVAMLADQGALGPASTFVPFFGRPAKTPRGPAVFALRLGVPLFFAAAVRQPDGRFHMSFEPIALADTGNRERDVEMTVAAYTSALERYVRRTPEQYFWHHRRWKWRPGSARRRSFVTES